MLGRRRLRWNVGRRDCIIPHDGHFAAFAALVAFVAGVARIARGRRQRVVVIRRGGRVLRLLVEELRFAVCQQNNKGGQLDRSMERAKQVPSTYN